MSEAKYTRGPWSIGTTENAKSLKDWHIEIGSKQLSFFPYVYRYADEAKTYGGYVSDPEMHANATLIAAAPDLLEALQELADLVEDMRNGEYEPDSFTTQPAYTAIAKALGADNAN